MSDSPNVGVSSSSNYDSAPAPPTLPRVHPVVTEQERVDMRGTVGTHATYDQLRAEREREIEAWAAEKIRPLPDDARLKMGM